MTMMLTRPDGLRESYGPAGLGAARGCRGLSPREREVLVLIAHGHTNAEMAAELFVSMATVKTHVNQLLRKLSARDRVALVILAWRSGLVG